MTTKPAHPGTIKMIDVYDKSVREVPFQSVPPREQFVMLDKDGIETNDPKLAVEHIPIVQVRVLKLDAKGELAPADRAVQMRILQYGPDERLLRSTTMTKD